MEILCFDFINSQWYAKHKLFKDLLFDQEWLNEFCLKWNLPYIDILNTQAVQNLSALREFLSLVCTEICKEKNISQENVYKLNKYLSILAFHKELKIDNGRLILLDVSEQSNIDYVIYQIVLSFTHTLTKYDFERIKLCQNPDCGWIFLDESNAKTRKWCDNTCASLMKVRKFRKNQSNIKI